MKVDIDNLKPHAALIAVIAIFIANIAYDYYWVTTDTTPPAWDQSSHLMSTLAYYNVLTNPSMDMLSKMLSIDTYYPPFYHFSVAVFYLFFGTSPEASIMANTVYLGILLFSIYGIGSRLFDKKTGVVAALLISLFPAVFNLQREFLIDFALLSMVSFTVYLLIVSDYFKNRNYTLMFGIAFALAILTKWTAIFFIIGPLCYVLFKAFIPVQKNKRCSYCGKEMIGQLVYSNLYFCSDKCKKEWKKQKVRSVSSNKKRIVTIVSSLFLAFVIASIWYIPNISIFKTISEGQQYWGTISGHPQIFTIASFVYYLFVLNNSVSFIFIIIFILGILMLFKKNPEETLFLSSIIIIPYLVLTVLLNKDGRYILPGVVSFAIIAAVPVSSIKTKKLFALAVLLISLIGIVQLFPYGLGLKSASAQTTDGDLYIFGPETKAPVKQDWRVEEVMQDIFQDAKTNNRVLTRGFGYVGVTPDMPYVNGLTYGYYSYSNKLPFNVINGVYLGYDNFASNLFNFDYVIVKSGKNEGSPYDKISESIRDYFNSNKGDKYILLKQYKLPDNTTLFTYKNTIT